MFKRFIASFICFTFSFTNLQFVQAQEFSIDQLPVPGTMVGESLPFAPLALKGLVVNPQKPLEFQFIVDTGRGPQDTATIKDQASQLVKYFLAGLTIPEGDLWVNLSPYEKNRMVPEALGQTDLGRDLLAQDYILKQLTASLIYPEKDLGKEFWSRVYAKAQQQFGTTNVPVNTFNKVWILPDQAQVFEHGAAAYVTKATLKVMLDEDYTALQKHMPVHNGTDSIGSQIVRQIILPEIAKEVNVGKNFAPLRQIYQALILAKWYKETIQNGLLDAIYTNKNKVAGVNLNDPAVKEQIYNRYLQAYKKGAFNYIKETSTPDGQLVPRKYFSGGITQLGTFRLGRTHDSAMVGSPEGEEAVINVDLKDTAMTGVEGKESRKDGAMLNSLEALNAQYKLGEELEVFYAPRKTDALARSKVLGSIGRYVYHDTDNFHRFVFLVSNGSDSQNHLYRLESLGINSDEFGSGKFMGVERTQIPQARVPPELISEPTGLIYKSSVLVALGGKLTLRVQKDFNIESNQTGDAHVTIIDDGFSFQKTLKAPYREQGFVTVIRIIEKAIEQSRTGDIDSDILSRTIDDMAMSTTDKAMNANELIALIRTAGFKEQRFLDMSLVLKFVRQHKTQLESSIDAMKAVLNDESRENSFNRRFIAASISFIPEIYPYFIDLLIKKVTPYRGDPNIYARVAMIATLITIGTKEPLYRPRIKAKLEREPMLILNRISQALDRWEREASSAAMTSGETSRDGAMIVPGISRQMIEQIYKKVTEFHLEERILSLEDVEPIHKPKNLDEGLIQGFFYEILPIDANDRMFFQVLSIVQNKIKPGSALDHLTEEQIPPENKKDEAMTAAEGLKEYFSKASPLFEAETADWFNDLVNSLGPDEQLLLQNQLLSYASLNAQNVETLFDGNQFADAPSQAHHILTQSLLLRLNNGKAIVLYRGHEITMDQLKIMKLSWLHVIQFKDKSSIWIAVDTAMNAEALTKLDEATQSIEKQSEKIRLFLRGKEGPGKFMVLHFFIEPPINIRRSTILLKNDKELSEERWIYLRGTLESYKASINQYHDKDKTFWEEEVKQGLQAPEDGNIGSKTRDFARFLQWVLSDEKLYSELKRVLADINSAIEGNWPVIVDSFNRLKPDTVKPLDEAMAGGRGASQKDGAMNVVEKDFNGDLNEGDLVIDGIHLGKSIAVGTNTEVFFDPDGKYAYKMYKEDGQATENKIEITPEVKRLIREEISPNILQRGYIKTNRGQRVYMVKTEAINGVRLDELPDSLLPEVFESFKEMFYKLLKFGIEVDFHPKNFIYGHRFGETKDRLWLIDTTDTNRWGRNRLRLIETYISYLNYSLLPYRLWQQLKITPLINNFLDGLKKSLTADGAMKVGKEKNFQDIIQQSLFDNEEDLFTHLKKYYPDMRSQTIILKPIELTIPSKGRIFRGMRLSEDGLIGVLRRGMMVRDSSYDGIIGANWLAKASEYAFRPSPELRKPISKDFICVICQYKGRPVRYSNIPAGDINAVWVYNKRLREFIDIKEIWNKAQLAKAADGAMTAEVVTRPLETEILEDFYEKTIGSTLVALDKVRSSPGVYYIAVMGPEVSYGQSSLGKGNMGYFCIRLSSVGSDEQAKRIVEAYIAALDTQEELRGLEMTAGFLKENELQKMSEISKWHAWKIQQIMHNMAMMTRRTFLRGIMAGLAQVAVGSGTSMIEAGKLLANFKERSTGVTISKDALTLFNIASTSYTDPNRFSDMMFNATANRLLRDSPQQLEYLKDVSIKTMPELERSTVHLNGILARLGTEGRRSELNELRLALINEAGHHDPKLDLMPEVRDHFDRLYQELINMPDEQLEELLLRRVQYLAGYWKSDAEKEIVLIKKALEASENTLSHPQEENQSSLTTSPNNNSTEKIINENNENQTAFWSHQDLMLNPQGYVLSSTVGTKRFPVYQKDNRNILIKPTRADIWYGPFMERLAYEVASRAGINTAPVWLVKDARGNISTALEYWEGSEVFYEGYDNTVIYESDLAKQHPELKDVMPSQIQYKDWEPYVANFGQFIGSDILRQFMSSGDSYSPKQVLLKKMIIQGEVRYDVRFIDFEHAMILMQLTPDTLQATLEQNKELLRQYALPFLEKLAAIKNTEIDTLVDHLFPEELRYVAKGDNFRTYDKVKNNIKRSLRISRNIVQAALPAIMESRSKIVSHEQKLVNVAMAGGQESRDGGIDANEFLKALIELNKKKDSMASTLKEKIMYQLLVNNFTRKIKVGEQYTLDPVPIYIGEGAYVKTSWDVPLMTSRLNTCSGLIVIDPAQRKHFLAHINEMKVNEQEIIDELKGMQITKESQIVINLGGEPTYRGLTSFYVIYRALKKLGYEKNIRFLYGTVQSDQSAFLIYQGRFYKYPTGIKNGKYHEKEITAIRNEHDILKLGPEDSAMTGGASQDGAIKVGRENTGGIDLNQINVKRTGKTISVQFDPAQLNELEQSNFKGFTPVIINITPISSPFQLLGINDRKQELQLAKA